ncbi:non-canonical purine NTP pyrophosphatase, rdgB/HAM1 family [Chloroherpeton thalassium ATCC 35110]|uniref:dITP/XTP pyrophosphatase n=1 Tax=Chloroherpeton thalassium (strain ATCC 35110 / GB-78) TaxID=517418 RepID=B3QTV0_CHLT3|nr:RdgB/HAM1 family non-canonical purine NTP pyrophosphatase [Chloroherpeton thalassium]ACF14298.1 non-canonical purine NTP pyrophosphatase, rdgB/HAM1 family [Chloroherpeton thalassium ATCC 35110]
MIDYPEIPAGKTALILATGNRDKVAEIKPLLMPIAEHLVIFSLADLPKLPEVEENAPTLEGNAKKKAKEIFEHTQSHFANLITLADDTGLEVAALNGAPGVYSARYAATPQKEKPSYADNVDKLLSDMQNLTNRTARFRTVIALVSRTNFGKESSPIYFEEVLEATVQGEITYEKHGSSGFGYDPIFRVSEVGKTFAELSVSEKNQISHRGKAVQTAVKFLTKCFLG